MRDAVNKGTMISIGLKEKQRAEGSRIMQATSESRKLDLAAQEHP